MIISLFQQFVELLYMYKNSKMYTIHVLLMFILFGMYIYYFFKERDII